MEYQYNDIPEKPVVVQSYDVQPEKSSMALASMVMGILGIVLSCCCMGTIFGGLAILFAFLSKTGSSFESKAKAGLIMGIIAICCAVIMFIAIIVYVSADSSLYSSLGSVAELYCRG